MCFHYHASKEAIKKKYSAKIKANDFLDFNEIVNAFEFPKMPIISNKNPDIISFYNWGLIPSWTKNNEIKKFTLNAKIETLHQKPSFKNIINNRCLIPATGFYEWQWLDPKGKQKQKHFITTTSNIFCFAGLWSEWINKNTGEVISTYTIITTEANKLMSKIHNSKKRMPVILNSKDEIKWLTGSNINTFKYPYESNLVSKIIL